MSLCLFHPMVNSGQALSVIFAQNSQSQSFSYPTFSPDILFTMSPGGVGSSVVSGKNKNWSFNVYILSNFIYKIFL